MCDGDPLWISHMNKTHDAMTIQSNEHCFNYKQNNIMTRVHWKTNGSGRRVRLQRRGARETGSVSSVDGGACVMNRPFNCTLINWHAGMLYEGLGPNILPVLIFNSVISFFVRKVGLK